MNPLGDAGTMRAVLVAMLVILICAAGGGVGVLIFSQSWDVEPSTADMPFSVDVRGKIYYTSSYTVDHAGNLIMDSGYYILYDTNMIEDGYKVIPLGTYEVTRR